MSSYQPGIPTGTVNLDVDYQNIQDNFQQANTSFGIDHVPFAVNTLDNPAGYHTSIHYVPVSTTVTNPPNNFPPTQPTTTGGFGQLFSAQINDGINIDEALFSLTGGGRLAQLTRNFVPQPPLNSLNSANPGYTFLPGGFILQWGRVFSTSSGTVNFPQTFPNYCYSVWTQPFASSVSVPNSQATVSIRSVTAGNNDPVLNTNAFQWNFVTNSSDYKGFFWIALGA